MGKIYTTLLFAALSFTAVSQDIEIFKSGSTVDISGTTVYASWQDPSLKKILTVKNNSASSKDLAVTRKKITEVTGAVDYLCWGLSLDPGQGQCYPASQVAPNNPWTSPDAYPFAAGSEGILWVYHTPQGNEGAAQYRYYIEENGVLLDSVDVVFNYFLSIPEDKPAQITVFPNPASEILNVTVENLKKTGSISIYDIAGKIITTSVIKNGKNQVNVESLNPGVYFYTLRNNEGVIETKKLLIQ